MGRGEKKKARAEIELLQKQFPNDAALYFVKGVMHRLDGEYDESLHAWDKLARLDPAARAVAAYNKARIYIYKGDYGKAMAEIEKGEKVEPEHPMLKIFRATLYYFENRIDDALTLMRDVLEDHPEMDGIRPLYAEFLAGAGRTDEARAQLTDDALSAARSDHDTAFWVGSTYSLLGENDLAFKWLNKAVKLGNENRPHFEHSKNLDPIRSDPRFAELMSKMGSGK
jgi:tetratricopeptide (TPR) repeat protein